MQDNYFDEIPIRDTIKLLHDKFSLLFYLDNVKSPKILRDIDSSISKCSDYSISSCAEIIIPPIIMAIHNCIENKCKTQLHQINDKREFNYNNGFDTKYTLQIEELLKVLFNVLQKISSKASKIVFSRISMAFFDILHVITKTMQTSIQERNEFIIELCVKIAHLDFNIFWEYWQYKDDTNTNKYLIIPVIVQFLLRIAIPNKDEIKYSKDIRVLSLKLLSEIPSIIKNSDSLLKVYPGVIQKLSIMVINSISEKNSSQFLEISLFALIEWIDYCLCNITPGTKKYNSNMENIKNTAKILNYIIKYKTIDLNIYYSSTDNFINSVSDEVCMIKIKQFFLSIANKCLMQLFDIFHDSFIEVLITSIDFLISIKCDGDYINTLVDNAFNSIITSHNEKRKLFFSDYLKNFLINFEQINMDKIILFEIDEENNLEVFIRTLTKYIGFQKIKSQFFQNTSPIFCSENILKFLFKMLISHRSITLYNKSIKGFNKTSYDLKYQSSSISMDNFNLKAVNITERVRNYLINGYSDSCTSIVDKTPDTINNFDVFQLYGDIITSTFFNNKKLGFEKSKLISGLIIKSISISILNLSVENTEYKYIFDCSMQCFSKLNTKALDEFDSMLDFIVRISFCNASQLISKQLAFGNSHNAELPNFDVNKLPDIIINWFEFTLKELNKDFLIENISNKKEINRNIILIFMGNLLFIAKEIGLENEIFIKKLNKVIIQLISLYGYGSPITKQIVAYILNQVMQMLGHFTNQFSINSVIKEYSVEIIRSLEMMCYSGYSKEKVYLILTALEHCKLEFILELSDIIERFSDINANNNHWIFESIAIITKRLSTYIVRHWSNTALRTIFKNTEMSVLKQKLESFPKNNVTLEVCYEYIADYIISQGNNERNISPTQSFIVNNTECQSLNSFEQSGDDLPEEAGIAEISNIRKIIKKAIHIIYPYTSNIDGQKFCVFDYQYLSTYSLINCIFILSTERSSLYPFVNMVIPTLINQWTIEINKIRIKEFGYFKTEYIKSRELYLTNHILIQLIVSSEDFAIKTLEDKLIPLITEYIEFVFSNKIAIQLMDDKEAEVNSEFQKLCISVMELLYFFTKFYLKLNIAEVKFETLNSIVNLLLSPINSFFSIKWRVFVSKTMLHIYFKFPSIISSKLTIHRKNSSVIHIKETIKMISLVENSIFSTFSSNNSIISETQGELNLKLKINKCDLRVAQM